MMADKHKNYVAQFLRDAQVYAAIKGVFQTTSPILHQVNEMAIKCYFFHAQNLKYKQHFKATVIKEFERVIGC